MSSSLDTEIRLVVTALVESAPPAPSLAEIEAREAQFASSRREGDEEPWSSKPNRARTRRVAIVFAIAACVVIAGSLVLAGRGVDHGGPVRAQAGTWKLMDDQLSGTWQQNPKGGPPPGYLRCPTTSVCYVMSGTYKSVRAGAHLFAESLYVTTNLGKSWARLPMPQGFDPTSELACGSSSMCAAGGTDDGTPVLLTTNDGGHTFEMTPLPAGVGHLDALTCVSAQSCAGLAALSEALNITTTDATLLSTNDGGRTFQDAQSLPVSRCSHSRVLRNLIARLSVGTTPRDPTTSLKVSQHERLMAVALGPKEACRLALASATSRSSSAPMPATACSAAPSPSG